MAKFRTDIKDISFNLFKDLKVQDHTPDYGENDLKDIIIQFDKFAENEVYSCRMEGDEQGVKLDPEKGVLVPESFKKATEQYYQNGWYALGYPEEIGGMPAPQSVTTACTSIYVGANVALSMYSGLSQGAMNVILQVGSDEQKEKFIPPMMEGRWGGTMCLTEPGAGSDVGAAKTTATPNDDGSFNIKGVKIFISSGESDIYENNIHMVLGRTPGSEEGTKGLSLFIVPRFKVNDDGTSGDDNFVKCTKIEEKMGIHGQATCELTFGGEGDCKGWLIGKEHDGIVNMFIMMNEARLLCGVQGEAQANLAYELTEQYAKERSQFKSEIAQLPDVKRMLLKMRAMSRGMRSLILYTANLFDLEHKGDELAIKELALLTPVCKGYCTDEGFQVAVDAIQVHGGYGYCSEYGIEQFARDAKIATIYEGTNGIQAMDFVMRKILKDKGETFQALGGKIQKSLAHPAAGEWKQETQAMAASMQKATQILEQYGKYAGEKDFDSILGSSTDFLTYCGNLIVAWRLLHGACIAKELLDQGDGDKAFLESKIIDFKIFCQHYLTRNTGIAQSILNYDQSWTSVEV
ncbi:MAG: acyl-CoA dehydrogenase [Halobacteriovoraceae bacterium]|nr:acyl-CoA dehydrogenase [Halobacteriovoraceae bacterium]